MYRACEVCHNTDIKTAVASSSIGAFSMNYCGVCLAMGAEQNTEWSTVTFKDDMYYNKDEQIDIVLNTGKRFKTRSDYVKYLNSI